jgi:hypothetical protein
VIEISDVPGPAAAGTTIERLLLDHAPLTVAGYFVVPVINLKLTVPDVPKFEPVMITGLVPVVPAGGLTKVMAGVLAGGVYEVKVENVD